jgi:ABC-type Fe3+-siderophore transport system permease subunit
MRTRSYGWGLGLLVAIAALALLGSLLIGPADLPVGRALAALSGGGDEMARTIMEAVRVPRSLSAFAVGSLLALAGVLLQALFRNPLADPFVLGVSGGAAVGALAGMLAGAGIALLHWYATAGAFAVGALVLLIGRTSDTAAAGRGGTGQCLRRGGQRTAVDRGQRAAARDGVLAGRGSQLVRAARL